MILGGFNGLDGFFHGADTLVVEIVGKLPALDLGVQAGNQLPQSRDLRLGSGSVGGDHFHDLARAAFAAMAALGLRQTDRCRNPFFEMIFGERLQARHADHIVEHGVRRTGAFHGVKNDGGQEDDIIFAELVLEAMFERGTGHAIRIGGHRADGMVAQLGIHFC